MNYPQEKYDEARATPAGGMVSLEDAQAEAVICSCDFKQLWRSLYGDDKPWRWVYELGEVE
jgi:hypothetical protein